MKIVLGRWQNKRLIQLDSSNAGRTSVGVRRQNGEYRYVRWLGFVSKDEAKRLGRPVKLEISRVGQGEDFRIEWVEVPPGRHVQGCLTREGVYAVVEATVKIV